MNRKTVFLTGSTGLIGSYLLKILLENEYKVFCLARAKGKKNAGYRVAEVLRFWDKTISHQFKNSLMVLEGDITQKNFGLEDDELVRLKEDVNVIYHCAACTSFNASPEVLHSVNVAGTENILRHAQTFNRLEKINYLSTTYIAGMAHHIVFTEEMLDIGQAFNNAYEKSKFDAEIMVRKYQQKGMDISVFRPSMVVGDFLEGKTLDFRAFYIPLRFMSREIIDVFPGDEQGIQNIVNVDTVARAVMLLGEAKGSNTYHIVSPNDVTIAFFWKVAAEYFGFRLPRFIPLEQFNISHLTSVQANLIGPHLAYFNYSIRYADIKAKNALKLRGFIFPEISRDDLLRIFKYCEESGFVKRKIST